MAAAKKQLVGAEEHKQEKTQDRLYPSFALQIWVGQVTGWALHVQRSQGAAEPMALQLSTILAVH